MSKGDRKREAAVQRRAEEERQAKERRQRRRRRDRLLSGVAVLAAGGVLAGVLAVTHHKKVTDPDYIWHHTIAAQSDETEITQAMMTYFINSSALNFATRYADQLDDLGLDVDKPLGSQTCYLDRTRTWLQYFADAATESVNWMLGFAGEAKAQGLTISDEDRAAIEKALARTTPTDYGEYVTEADVRACLELYYLASTQERAVNASLACSDEELEAYYEANKRKFLKADYASYAATFGDKGDYADIDAARAVAQELAAASTDEFEAKVKAALVASRVYSDETVDDGYVAECVNKAYSYKADDGFSDWLFADGRAAGDVTVVESDSAVTVYRVLSAPARDTSATVDVRHILLTSSTYGSNDKAKARAEELLAAWQAGDATEDSFAALAWQNTEDSNAAEGGLYEGVAPGQMVQAFNDWCFDAARRPGDTGIVQTGYGYHVMYFVGTHEAWYAAVRETVQNERYDAAFERYLADHHVTVNADVVSAISL